MSKISRFSLLATALLASQHAWCAQDRAEMDFPNHARLVYSAPVSPALSRTFGPGWTRLAITRPDGSTLPIMPDETLTADGGIIFSTVGANARSRDGRYVVLDLARNGVTQTEDGKPSLESRAFCPILDTQTGCVARDDTGAVCGGTWDDKDAVWHSQLDSGENESQGMTTLEKPAARAVWAQFSQAKSTDIKPFLRVALGIENLRACDPPNAGNASDYAKIQAALAHSAHTAIDRRSASSMPTDVRIGMTATPMLSTDHAAAAPQSTLRFALPGGAAILYSEAANPRDPLPERTWKKAVFYLPNGATFGLLPIAGESDAGGGTQMEPPSDGNISPSGQYVVVARDEQGTVSTGSGEPESVMDREYCSMIEIRTGCITADQTGELCGAGWRAGQRAQWGTDEQTDLMLKRDRPSASRQLGFINAGQPPKLTIRDDSGADNLLRCDPPSSPTASRIGRLRQPFRRVAHTMTHD